VAFHAAQALIFEKTGTIAKTHAGVRQQFGRLVQNDPRCDADLRSFLGRSYNLRALVDYETGPRWEVPDERAVWAMATSQRFVDFVARSLADDYPGR
jgi:uncharacterized protein (UPF0332 family)